jgi:replicative DNA helicase
MIESMVLAALVHDDSYGRAVLPFLKTEYFRTSTERHVFGLIDDYVKEYSKFPTPTILTVEADKLKGITSEEYTAVTEMISSLEPVDADHEWMLKETEQFCKDRAIFNAISEAIKIIDDKSRTASTGSIPAILEEALAVSFDTNIGHDFIEDASARYDFYHRTETRLPFDIDYLNKVTKGGLPRKTLNVILAGTGVGKSLFMCHCAASHLSMGKNVLYITLEMAEERIAERIDANLLNTKLADIEVLPRETFEKRIQKVKAKTTGRLIIKEYPTSTANTGHFRHLLNELRLKRKFAPDIIYVDYLNICSSSRVKQGSNVNSYTYVKSIAEELRGLAVEFNVPIVSATQTTRSGYSSSDPGLEDTSESFGLPATVDLMMAMVSSEELEQLGQVMFKQLKNRYNDPSSIKRFVVGIDRNKMRLYDVEQSAQADIVVDNDTDDAPLYDRSQQGRKFNKGSFQGFS